MLLVNLLLSVPAFINGVILDRVFGPDELASCSWPSTTPDGDVRAA